jgi:hypothetical protein
VIRLFKEVSTSSWTAPDSGRQAVFGHRPDRREAGFETRKALREKGAGRIPLKWGRFYFLHFTGHWPIKCKKENRPHFQQNKETA